MNYNKNMEKEWMPKGGVKELKKSKSGMEYLAKLQRRHKIDILQPGEPGFDKVYGSKIKQDEKMHAKQRLEAKDARAEYESRKEFDRTGSKYY